MPQAETTDVWYAGKTHDFGGNIQALFYPSGISLWVSDVLPVDQIVCAVPTGVTNEWASSCSFRWRSCRFIA
jgi:hypothetical protein